MDAQDVVTTSKGVGYCLERKGSDPCCTMNVPWGRVCEYAGPQDAPVCSASGLVVPGCTPKSGHRDSQP